MLAKLTTPIQHQLAINATSADTTAHPHGGYMVSGIGTSVVDALGCVSCAVKPLWIRLVPVHPGYG